MVARLREDRGSIPLIPTNNCIMYNLPKTFSSKLCPECGKNPIKYKHTMCRKCFIGEERYKKEKDRISKVRIKRRMYKPKWSCSMGYENCNRRKYCNGDC